MCIRDSLKGAAAGPLGEMLGIQHDTCQQRPRFLPQKIGGLQMCIRDRAHSVKTRQMVSQVDHFDTIFVTSEFEALVLENSLIQRHMPRYNSLPKDDKGYPLVRLSRGRYPKSTLVNRPANDGAKYFGP